MGKQIGNLDVFVQEAQEHVGMDGVWTGTVRGLWH